MPNQRRYLSLPTLSLGELAIHQVSRAYVMIETVSSGFGFIRQKACVIAPNHHHVPNRQHCARGRRRSRDAENITLRPNKTVVYNLSQFLQFSSITSSFSYSLDAVLVNTLHRKVTMTYTIVFYVKKQPALSYPDFEDHYENIHMPLIKAATGTTFPNKHVRYYVKRSSPVSNEDGSTSLPPAMIYGKPEAVNYDAVVMLDFDDEQAWKRYESELATSEKSKEIMEDALKFMELESVVAVALDGARVTER
ncbi:hypothetical protein BDV96DRAFT_586818 [Lophiotrema nucula]|uniref:EthD domain-containing protein n=1 Tax=Lophiotrema nucula TaxID=690887 RepID=A0A6A5YP58_9PLEO|nr:hypothetical protein BDV96DRAFT_586818 [Lophiotrema nucula]